MRAHLSGSLAAVLAVAVVGCSGGGGKGSAGDRATTTSARSAVVPTTPAGSEPTGPTTAAPTTAAPARGPTPDRPCGGVRPDRYDHVVWIWMENHTAGQVLGSQDAPFETDLAARCGSSVDYRSVGSPSLPNYLAATSGSTHGVHDDGPPASHPIDGENLFRQVREAGGTARSYEEAMPGPCALDGSGRYAVKHNPQAYYRDAADQAACATDDVPLGALAANGGGSFVDDLSNGHLPTFSFVTPDLCDDTHDCPVAAGDAWLRDWVMTIVGSSTYAEGRTALFVVWDEPTPMPLLVVAPGVPTGATASAQFDHYSLLRTTEELLGLAPPLGQAATATSMRGAFGL
jgi:hypothetical protein